MFVFVRVTGLYCVPYFAFLKNRSRMIIVYHTDWFIRLFSVISASATHTVTSWLIVSVKKVSKIKYCVFYNIIMCTYVPLLYCVLLYWYFLCSQKANFCVIHRK